MEQKSWMRFFVWGAGALGERLTWHFPSTTIRGFIDSSEEKIGGSYCGKPVISFQDFLEKYNDHYIIIATYNYYPIRDVLEKNEVTKYYLMTDLPGDISAPIYRSWMKDYIIEDIQKHTSVAIVGCNPFSFLVGQWVYEYSGREAIFLRDMDEKAPYLQLVKDGFVCHEWKHGTIISDRIYLTTRSSVNAGESEKNALNIWDCTKKIEKYHHPKLSIVKNLFKGQRCFLIGNGPSLRMSDLDKLQENKELCFGVSEIYKAFAKTSWRPSFYVGGYEMMRKGYREEIMHIESSCIFLTDDSERCEEMDSKKNVFRFHMHQSAYTETFPPFSEDCTICCQHGGTIIYLCMQLAVYMGFQSIFLLGVDFTHGEKGSRIEYSHFYEETPGDISTCCEEIVEKSYLSAKQYVDTHDVRIYNATRGGMLEVFPRVDFDRLFEK